MTRPRRIIFLTLCLGLLSACAGGPVGNPEPLTAPAYADGWIEGADGTRLALSTYPARGREKAVLIGVHGYGDFGPSTFGPAAAYWSKQGITTYAYDQRGFGRNPDRRLWPGPEILISDLIEITRLLRARHPNMPVYVTGHSMGGGVTLAAAADGLEADGIILAGPAIAGGDRIDPASRTAGWLIATLAPDRRFTGKGVVKIVPTDNRDVWRRVASDPRHYGDPSGRELMGLIRIMDTAAAAAPRVTIPTLTVMGTNDQILRPSAVETIHNRIPGAVAYRLYEDGWHWIYRDLKAPVVWADVAEFVLRQ